MQLNDGRRSYMGRLGPIAGLGLLGLGLLLVLGVGAFFIYSWRASSGLEDLVVPAPTVTPPRVEVAPTPSSGEVSIGFSPEAIAAQRMFPGEALPPVNWRNPMETELGYAPANPLVAEFGPVPAGWEAPWHSLPVPLKITIPAISVDSEVTSLQILDLGNSLEYETPKNLVGHIPETHNPGEEGTAWFFGHLESPVAGEGHVFRNLPDIPAMLRRGEEVYAVVESSSGSFLYQITESLVLGANDLSLSYADIQQTNPEYTGLDSSGAILHLVTCVPRLVYDHRLVVSGQLVGVSRS